MTTKTPFLFSVDVEDFPVRLASGEAGYEGRLDELMEKYLAFLRARGMQATFFVLGQVAEEHPEVVRRILAEGHEVGSHGYAHVPLDKHTPESFRADVARSLVALRAAGATDVQGYRAPFLSLIPSTAWAWPILAELGFRYSSSVMPGYNPLYGWKGFGAGARRESGIWELPVTTMPVIPFGVALAGGLYFRVLPWLLVGWLIRRHAVSRRPVLSYFHPYDLDHEAVNRTCEWLADRPVSNFFLFYNRKDLVRRLERVMRQSFEIVRYRDYLAGLSKP